MSIKEKLHSPFGLFALASLNWFALGLVAIAKDVSYEVTLIVVGFFVAVLIIQLLILKLFTRLVALPLIREKLSFRGKLPPELVSFGAFGFILMANMIAFFLAFSERFISMPEINIALVSFLGGVILSLLFLLLSRNEHVRLFVVFILVLNPLLVGASQIVPLLSGNSAKGQEAQASFEKYRNIKFRDKPNVHLVSIDSMIPATLARKHMGLDSLRYGDYLESEGSLVFENMFVSAEGSKASLNSIMRLANPDFEWVGFFAGRRESPVSYIFQNNGYKIATGFNDESFFGKQGNYVDEYRNVKLPRFGQDSFLCKVSSGKEKYSQLYGFCNFLPAGENRHLKDEWRTTVIETISEKGANSNPWLTFHYLTRPIGHTFKSYDNASKEQRDAYIRGFLAESKILDRFLLDLVASIKETDPASIVFIFGDHGTFLSRSVKRKENPEFFVQDRYGVFGALLDTDHPCASSDINYYNQQYSTPDRVLAGIIRCLSVDPEYIDQAVNFEESIVSLSDYTYELDSLAEGSASDADAGQGPAGVPYGASIGESRTTGGGSGIDKD